MSHPKIELTYFPVRGLTESVRLMLAFVGAEYTEKHIQSKEEWLALKPTLPYGQVPLLTIDGKRLVQRRAIEQYIARTHHLYGKNDDETYEIDSLLESVFDFFTASPLFALLMRDPNVEEKAKEFENGALKKYLDIWDQHLAKKGNLFFVGNSHTFADVSIFNALRYFKDFPRFAHILDGREHLKKFYESIENHPNIQKYLKGPHNHPFPPSAELMTSLRAMLYS